MAKDYSWLKFKISDWMMGRIQKQKPEVRGVFLDLVCKYWQKQCKLSIEDAKEELEEVDYAYDSLLSKKIIKENDGMVVISFLDEQWAENEAMLEHKRNGGKASAAKRVTHVQQEPTGVEQNPTAVEQELTGVQQTSTEPDFCSTIKNEIREEEIRIDEKRVEENENINNSLSDASTDAPTETKVSLNKWIEGFDTRKIEFQESLYPYTKHPPKYNGSYAPEMVKKFFDYWSEPNKSRSKMKWETEKTWDLGLRLSRWASSPINNKTNNQKTTGNVHQTAISAAKSGFHTVQTGK